MAHDRGCDPHEIALKTFFLGPQAENRAWLKDTTAAIFDSWCSWRRSIHPEDGNAISAHDQREPLFLEHQNKVSHLVMELLNRFSEEVPKFSPRYNSHMFSEISLPALLGHIIALLHNPNNISGETSRIGIKIEDEAVGDLAQMLGYDPKSARGHFTSGGTVANFEALFRARLRLTQWLTLGAYMREVQNEAIDLVGAAHMGWARYSSLLAGADREGFNFWLSEINPPSPHFYRRISKIFQTDYNGPVILVPNHKHYSWMKGTELTGLSTKQVLGVPLDRHGQIDLVAWQKVTREALEDQTPILMSVSVCGSTELGSIDPIHRLSEALKQLLTDQNLHLWHHADAAYGGYFATTRRMTESPLAEDMIHDLEALAQTTSLTLDPHKLGYVPYASGLFLAASKQDYDLYHVDAPYVQFDAREDRGPQTLEGSRSAAGAVATWLTSKSIGLDEEGYGRILARSIHGRLKLEVELLKALPEAQVVHAGNTNILAFTVARPGDPTSRTNRRALEIYEALSARHEAPFYASKTRLSFKNYGELLGPFVKQWNGQIDTDSVELVRFCILNPFFSARESKTDFAKELATEVARIFKNNP